MSISLSIYTYNIAGKTQSFAKDFMRNVIETKSNPEQFIIFCFQEVSGQISQSDLDFEKVELLYIQNGCQSITTSFNLATVVFVNKEPFMGKESISFRRMKKCTHLGFSINNNTIKYYGNKGALYTILKVADESYLIINTHAPFASEKGITGGSYDEFWQSFILSIIKRNKMAGKTFIVGDLNSRSLINLDDFGIQKTPRIKNAIDNHFKFLQSLPYHQQEQYANKSQVQRLLNLAQNLQTLPSDDKQKLQLLKKKLIRGDYLSHYLQQFLVRSVSHIRDISQIKNSFLPTYKIDPNLNKYRLMKDNNLRLPGYADRILTDINPYNIQPIEYNSLKKFGSTDHFPVYAIFKFETPKLTSLSSSTMPMSNIASTIPKLPKPDGLHGLQKTKIQSQNRRKQFQKIRRQYQQKGDFNYEKFDSYFTI